MLILGVDKAVVVVVVEGCWVVVQPRRQRNSRNRLAFNGCICKYSSTVKRKGPLRRRGRLSPIDLLAAGVTGCRHSAGRVRGLV